MSDRLRTAIVGCGAISHWHLDAIDRANVPITVTAAVDPDEANAKRIAERTGWVKLHDGTDWKGTKVGELRIALAMYRSAETKQWEKVWS